MMLSGRFGHFMKKPLSLALVIALILTFTIPVFAGPKRYEHYDYPEIEIGLVSPDSCCDEVCECENSGIDPPSSASTELPELLSQTFNSFSDELPNDEPLIMTAGIALLGAPAQIVTWKDGFGFHCNANGGNGATAVWWDGEKYEKGEQKDVFGTETSPIRIERIGGTRTWLLLTDEIICDTCGSSIWVTYSNKSKDAPPSGKNIQAHHPEKSEEEPDFAIVIVKKIWRDSDGSEIELSDDLVAALLSFTNDWTLGEYWLYPGTRVKFSENPIEGYTLVDITVTDGDGNSVDNASSDDDLDFTAQAGETYTIVFTNQADTPMGTISIEKMIDKLSLKAWLADEKNKDVDLKKHITGFELYAYDVDTKKPIGDRIGDLVTIQSVIDHDGMIIFTESVPAGWYTIVEKLTENGKNFFSEPDPPVFYFNGSSVVDKDAKDHISGADSKEVVFNNTVKSVGGGEDKPPGNGGDDDGNGNGGGYGGSNPPGPPAPTPGPPPGGGGDTELDDDPVPQGPGPGNNTPGSGDGDLDIPDGDTPLSELPATGSADHYIELMLIGLMLILIGLSLSEKERIVEMTAPGHPKRS